MSDHKGLLSIVLHAHLPFVRHPEYDQFFEENWLFEAITECYIPLLQVLARLSKDQVNYRLTLSLSPPLIAMLSNELLQTRYLAHLNKQIELTEKEISRTQGSAQQALAKFYQHLYLETLEVYSNQYAGNLLSAFQQFHSTGHLELITCAATHGFLPLLNKSEATVRTQIDTGIASFVAQFGFTPAGFWLPECAYYPGLEAHLQSGGIHYFFVDAHGIEHASQRPVNGVYAPLNCGNGVLAFARDPESSQQVWSTTEGYPGDYDYREYHSDIGFDLDLDYIAPYILDNNVRINTGIKYHRVTGEDLPKEIYLPEQAAAKARLHAEDFINKCQQQIEQLSANMDRPPIIVAPFDAELFGHWWFEGPQWLEWVLRLADADSSKLKTSNCSDYLQQVSAHQVATPSASTWGDQGYSKHWINETNDWVYPLLHKAADDLEKLVLALQSIKMSSLQERALNQALRSLLLAQASDWPFILKTGTTVEYAKKRITDHLARFNYLLESVKTNAINERYLSALEILDEVFPDVNFRDFHTPK
ncbi:MAG: 1,4-alpha-glucan branching enzyme [Methyloprofundus sp.]|nr:MAG: 1,4-alpha-glucan branching enzyme [Methyloprofundus sp.]